LKYIVSRNFKNLFQELFYDYVTLDSIIGFLEKISFFFFQNHLSKSFKIVSLINMLGKFLQSNRNWWKSIKKICKSDYCLLHEFTECYVRMCHFYYFFKFILFLVFLTILSILKVLWWKLNQLIFMEVKLDSDLLVS